MVLTYFCSFFYIFFFKQKTAYEMRISDWSSDVCSSDLTISKINMTPEGYPVYGANGQIGFYDKFNHEHPTIVIGCRGSCGTVHITLANSYTTGNVMALDDLDYNRISLEFLYHYLRKRDRKSVV